MVVPPVTPVAPVHATTVSPVSVSLLTMPAVVAVPTPTNNGLMARVASTLGTLVQRPLNRGPAAGTNSSSGSGATAPASGGTGPPSGPGPVAPPGGGAAGSGQAASTPAGGGGPPGGGGPGGSAPGPRAPPNAQGAVAASWTQADWDEKVTCLIAYLQLRSSHKDRTNDLCAQLNSMCIQWCKMADINDEVTQQAMATIAVPLAMTQTDVERAMCTAALRPAWRDGFDLARGAAAGNVQPWGAMTNFALSSNAAMFGGLLGARAFSASTTAIWPQAFPQAWYFLSPPISVETAAECACKICLMEVAGEGLRMRAGLIGEAFEPLTEAVSSVGKAAARAVRSVVLGAPPPPSTTLIITNATRRVIRDLEGSVNCARETVTASPWITRQSLWWFGCACAVGWSAYAGILVVKWTRALLTLDTKKR